MYVETQSAQLNFATTINQLVLHHFRCFMSETFRFDGKHVFISGENGSGKTALLEALSLFSPGRGLRQAKFSDMQHFDAASQDWCVRIHYLTACHQSFQLATACEQKQGGEKRLLKLEHTFIKQNELQELIQVVWLTPQLERQFHASQAARRKFLDRLIGHYDPSHLGRISKYEKWMAQRSFLLKQSKFDPLWLDVLEQDLSKVAVAIIASRLDFVEQLQAYCHHLSSEFPEITVGLSGALERDLTKYAALDVEQKCYETLKAARQLSETMPVGAHKSQLELHLKAEKLPYHLCSSGQQKAILIRLLLGHVALLSTEKEMAPVILLDDICAHLDERRLHQLVHELDCSPSQVFYTSTDFPKLTIKGKAEIALSL